MRRFRSITSSTDANVYVGPFGELVVDNSNKIRVQDGVTPGGTPLSLDTGNLTFNGSTISTSDPSGITIDSTSLSITSNLIPTSDMLTNLGANDRMFSEAYVANIKIYEANDDFPTISTVSSNLFITVGRHAYSLHDVSIGENPNVGTGSVFSLDDVAHSNGPTMETWYGNVATPWDPPGQHSLDIHASETNLINYVELASPDWNNYVGVNADHVFVNTNWNVDPSQIWTFEKTGGLTLTQVGHINSRDGFSTVSIKNGNVSIRTTDLDDTTEHYALFERSGNVTIDGSLLPTSNVTYSLGSPEFQWKDLWVSSNTIYIGSVPLSINNGELVVNGNAVVGGEGLPTVTISPVPATTYKGLQVAYGRIYDNGNPNELNVSKIVIHKPANAIITIDPDGTNDDFRVSGISTSDVLAMFVLYGDVNGAKTLSVLQTFAEAAINNVILNGGVEGSFNTVDAMKTAFYNNYATLATAAGGLYTNFQFYSNVVNTIDAGDQTGATITREGSGATFNVNDVGDTTYALDSIDNGGTNYLPGHQIKIPGTNLGGTTPDNDAVITVQTVGEGGVITTATISGTAAGSTPAGYTSVSGTNYQVGNGLRVSGISRLNDNTLEASVFGFGGDYVIGDVLTLPGTSLYTGTSPTNDITLVVTGIGGGTPTDKGPAYNTSVTGTLPNIWPINSINDGGVDQYDTANYINTNLAVEINYDAGNTIVDGTAVFGAGSSYSFVYDTAMFGLFATGSSAEFISTSGGSGADGNSTTDVGNIYDAGSPQQSLTNAVTHINVYGTPYLNTVTFTNPDYGNEVDILIPDDGNGAGVGITRSNNQGIYNPYREGSWDSDVSPGGTLWNIDGWDDLTNVASRLYAPLYETFGFGGLGNKIVGAECVMYLPDNGKYYTVKFSSWTQNNNGGGFVYTRKELNLSTLEQGIKFPDGTVLTSAEGVGRVKSTASGSRKIEEVAGNKTVTVTERVTQPDVSVTAWDTRTDVYVYISWDQALYDLYNGATAYGLEFSKDNSTWYTAQIVGYSFNNYIQLYMTGNQTVSVTQGDTVYYRVSTGGDPVVWWSSADLPSGSANFRGAVIDYHAFSGDSTIIGTIHIVDDDGDENITHTEVTSGGTDGENNDMWLVQNEGTISYRRIDGEQSTLKVHWIAKVFYGSEIYD